ncbi:Imm49 family immunity protein [Streptomyces sp. NPDC020858]|uniref:immunity 49 family protein n=1 Tax=Streptomyces sp. NPDC020858 TaxID=3365097 RepID=UPI0037B60730
MRIERHQVGEAAVSAARADFVNRIEGQAHSMSRGGRMATYEWRLLAEEHLDYLGALSVEMPDLDDPEAAAVLKDATEAAAGAVAYAAYHPHVPFQIMLIYANFGMSYDPGDADDGNDTVTPGEWIDAFCLAILSGKASWHGEAFRFACRAFGEIVPGTPSAELVKGFTAQVIGVTDDDDADRPPTPQEKLAAVDAALDRIRRRGEASGPDLLDRPHAVGLRTLRALAAGDREAFDSGLAALLLDHSALPGPKARPHTLLPLLPLALAALAYRSLGWTPAVDTDYLPHALVTGFETSGPRVGGFGRDRRPDAVAALAAGPLVVDRPAPTEPWDADMGARFEEYTREALAPVDGEPPSVGRLAGAMRHQEIHFKVQASHFADVTDAQVANLRLASQVGAALFRIALAEPGTEVQVTVDGRTLGYPATRGRDTSPGSWQDAVAFALITGVREDLAPLVLTGPTHALEDGSAFASYREALHDYLRGVDPRPTTERALRDVERAKDWGFTPPPAVLFSQLVEGGEESFNLALADAVEAHRDHYRVGDRAETCDAAIDLDILALACHARRRGWNIRVESPYLPQRLLRAAAPF